jgi:hypothetical protein
VHHPFGFAAGQLLFFKARAMRQYLESQLAVREEVDANSQAANS